MVRLEGRSHWIVRYWPKGSKFEGKKLRSSRVVYKVLDYKEYEDSVRKYRRGNKPMKLQSQCYTKRYARNIDKTELTAILEIVKQSLHEPVR